MLAAIIVLAFLIGTAGFEAHAQETGERSRFEEHSIEFQNQDVKLAGSLLLPTSEVPVPAIVFVHGAGPQSRQQYRELGEFFARRGFAALIYDKRGTGQSGGAYESHEPYTNLVNDSLSAVDFLRQRREIAPSQIGIWGLSQGAYISAAAAARSDDIRFIVVVGASVTNGMMFYYRDNLFRRYELPATLRDVAEKAQLLQDTLPNNLRNESFLSSFLPRSYPPADQYIHPVWSQVHQPVLAMWGQLDQNVPVGESVAGLKHSLAQTNNENWTILILPRTNHSMKISETGVLNSGSSGYYSPSALQTMTDWAHNAIDHPEELGKMKQEGIAPEAGILPRLASYENLRWYGNGTVQASLWMLFFFSFGTNTLAGVWNCCSYLFRSQQKVALATASRAMNLMRAICAFNFLILVAFSIVVWLVLDQLHPSCPSVLRFVPLLGTISTLATIVLLITLAKAPRDHGWSAARKIGFSLEVLCLVLFLPFLFYWNLIGICF